MSWLEEAKKRCEEATQGPWEMFRSGFICREEDGSCICCPGCSNCSGNDAEVSKPDMDFIANARTDLPRALELLERARELIETSGTYDVESDVYQTRARKWLSEVEG